MSGRDAEYKKIFLSTGSSSIPCRLMALLIYSDVSKGRTNRFLLTSRAISKAETEEIYNRSEFSVIIFFECSVRRG